MQLLASQDVNWWTGVVWISCGLLWCFYQLFGLSFWRHPFTAQDELVSKLCNAKFLQICSDEEKLIYILDGLRVSKSSSDFRFWVNHSFKRTTCIPLNANKEPVMDYCYGALMVFFLLFGHYEVWKNAWTLKNNEAEYEIFFRWTTTLKLTLFICKLSL